MLDRILDATNGTIADEADPGETVSSGGAVWVLEAETMQNDVVEQPGGSLESVLLPDGTSIYIGNIPGTSE